MQVDLSRRDSGSWTLVNCCLGRGVACSLLQRYSTTLSRIAMQGASESSSALGAPSRRAVLQQMRQLQCYQGEASDPPMTKANSSKSRKKRNGPPRAFISMAAEKIEDDHEEEPAFQKRTSSTTLSHLSSDLFSSLRINAELLKAMAVDFKYESMTEVQAATIPVSLKGVDVLAKAKTGTGKTIAFLIPAINRVVDESRERGLGISILVVSPTRELAHQIADEGNVLIKYHKGMSLACVVGGTNVNGDLSRFERNTPDILVGTPGRLLDHLQNYTLANKLKKMNVLVLDECDRLLDMGFHQDIEKITRYLPRERQTLLFSATLPTDVQSMCERVLKPSYEVVDCVGEEESTHQHVSQMCIISSLRSQTQDLLNVLKKNSSRPNFKIIVFFTTARLTQFYAELFNLVNMPVLEIHSRKSQGHRNKVSESFRNGSNLIMFTSDVSARGMDYPDVTLVVQVGLPANKEQYIHRLGRTARGGKGGEGVLMLAEFEENFLQQVSDLPIEVQELEAGHDFSVAISKAVAKLPEKTIGAAYQAWLGFYKSNLKVLRFDKEELVRMGNKFASEVCDATQPPPLLASTVGKMGLRGVPGLNIAGKNTQARGQNMGRGTEQRFRPADSAGGRGRGRSPGRGGPYGRSRGRQESGEGHAASYGGKRIRKEDAW